MRPLIFPCQFSFIFENLKCARIEVTLYHRKNFSRTKSLFLFIQLYGHDPVKLFQQWRSLGDSPTFSPYGYAIYSSRRPCVLSWLKLNHVLIKISKRKSEGLGALRGPLRIWGGVGQLTMRPILGLLSRLISPKQARHHLSICIELRDHWMLGALRFSRCHLLYHPTTCRCIVSAVRLTCLRLQRNEANHNDPHQRDVRINCQYTSTTVKSLEVECKRQIESHGLWCGSARHMWRAMIDWISEIIVNTQTPFCFASPWIF